MFISSSESRRGEDVLSAVLGRRERAWRGAGRAGWLPEGGGTHGGRARHVCSRPERPSSNLGFLLSRAPLRGRSRPLPLTLSLSPTLHTRTHPALTSTLAWAVAYVGTAAASHRLSPAYRALSTPAARAGWDSRVTSTLHALAIVALACIGGSQLLTGHETGLFAAGTALTLRATPLTRAALGMSAGYFLVDLALVLRHAGLGGPPMVAHHVSALAALAIGGTRDEGHLYTLALMLAEATTPLVNARYFLDAAGLRSHWAYLANGLALTASWGLVRVLGFAAFFVHLARHWADVQALSPACRLLLTTVPVLFSGLNLYWFGLLLKGAVKVLRGGSGKGSAVAVEVAAPADTPAPPSTTTTATRRRSPSPLPRRVSFSDSPPVRAPLTRARAGVPKPSALARGGGGGAEGGDPQPRWWATSLVPARVAQAWA